MPFAAPKPCTYPGCGTLVRDGGSRCEKHKRTEARIYDQQRGTRQERGYDNKWDKARKGYLRSHPLCAECQRQGRLTPASEVDHIIPHRLDMKVFWDYDNWQALCKSCHSAKTATEDGGFGNRRTINS